MGITSAIALFFKRSLLGKLLLTVLVIISIFGSLIHFIEPETFPTVFDGIWWAIVTAATVGYGDYAPYSLLGRIVGILLILIGVGLVTQYFVAVSTTNFMTQNDFMEGKTTYKGKKHIIIIGWNARVKETINHITSSNPLIEIILIDESLEQNPLPSNHVHFIKGNPTHDDILEKANIQEADMVLITADQGKNEVHADMLTILTLLAIKGMNPSAYSIVEILTPQQVNNARRGGADEIIQTNRLSSFVMINSIISHGISEALLTMLVDFKGCRLHFFEATFDLIGMSFKDCSEKLMGERSILIGLKRADEIIINPPHTLEIRKSDQLLVIKD